MPTADEIQGLLREAHDFTPPEAFVAGWVEGWLPDLLLTDLEWMPPEAIAGWDHGYGRRRDLVPFAHSARMDVYAWDLAGAPAPTPVVWSPRESREATRFAPDFSGFLFRVLLLECAGSWHFEDLEPDEFDDLQRRQVATLAPWLGRARHSVLEALVAPGFRADPEDPSVGLVISLEEATALASEHLGGFLDEPVPSRAEPR